MTLLPQKLTWDMAQNKWASILNPLLKNPASNPSILQNISLASGANSINHKLGQPLQGWYIVRMQDAFAEIYDTQNSNQTPQLTLNLNASAPVVVDIAVF